MPLRHAERGLSSTSVSYMLIGAGSRALSARPTLPTTEATSGKLRRTASCFFMMSIAWVRDTELDVTGMNMSVPSSSGGMNSRPMPAPSRASSQPFAPARPSDSRASRSDPVTEASTSAGWATGASRTPPPATSTRLRTKSRTAAPTVRAGWRSAAASTGS